MTGDIGWSQDIEDRHWVKPVGDGTIDLELYDDEIDDWPPLVDLQAERDQLARWKAEAQVVLADWLHVWNSLGRPGVLGESLAHASEQEVARLAARLRSNEEVMRTQDAAIRNLSGQLAQLRREEQTR